MRNDLKFYFRDFTQRIFGYIVWFVDICIPKDKNKWVLTSHASAVSNFRILVDALLRENVTAGRDGNTVKIYLNIRNYEKSTREYFRQEKTRQEIFFFNPRSLRAIYVYMRAGVIFITHDTRRDTGCILTTLFNRRLIVNVWHGIATKRHWGLSRNRWSRHDSRSFNHVVASSIRDAVSKCACFHKPLDNIKISGYPRNDILIKERLSGDLSAIETKIHNILEERHLILYAPTWRVQNDHFDPFSRDALNRLREMIDRSNAAFGIRLHPKMADQFDQIFGDLDFPIIDLGSRRVKDTNLLLRNTKLLITDYSSIWFDFLLTGRPVIAYWPDYDRYKSKRGVIWDLDVIFPGPICRNETMLLEALAASMTHDFRLDAVYDAKYRLLTGLMHKYRDGKNAERLVRMIRNLQAPK